MRRLILLLGPHGSGKSTLGRELKDACGAGYYGGGDLIRAEMARGTERGLACRELMDAGHSVPLEISYGLLREALADDSSSAVILDGYPRYVDQVGLLEDMTGRAVDQLLVLEAPPEIRAHRIRHRLSCTECFATFGPGYPGTDGRCRHCEAPLERRPEDDDPRAIVRRDDVWREEGHEIVEYYRAAATVDHLSSDGPVPDVVRLASEFLDLALGKPIK